MSEPEAVEVNLELDEEDDWELPSAVEVYRGDYRMAIVDALNVLGAATACRSKEVSCLGCQYERDEAMRILYGALGLELDLEHPELSYAEYETLRVAEWQARYGDDDDDLVIEADLAKTS